MLPPYAPEFTLVLAASIALDVAIVLAVIAMPARRHRGYDHPPARPITLRRCLAAAVLVFLAWVPKAILSRALGVHLFGWMNLLYCTAAFAAPAVGILVHSIPALRRRLTRPARVFAIASLTAIPMFVWCSIIEPRRIVFEAHPVPIAGVTEPITIVVLADIQSSRITARERDIAARVNALNPDLILIPGDLWQDRGSLGFEPLSDDVAAEFREFLRSLRARHGVYFSPGNAEDGYDWRPLVESAGVTCLENQTTTIRIGDQDVVIAGTEWNSNTIEFQRFIDSMESDPRAGPTLLMSHTPDVLYDTIAYYDNLFWSGTLQDATHAWPRTDLIISGHTHGGQVQLPGLGPLITFSLAPRHICAGGLFPLDEDTHICVSRGIGIERGQAPRLRFLCPPEVTVLTLRAPHPSSQ